MPAMAQSPIDPMLPDETSVQAAIRYPPDLGPLSVGGEMLGIRPLRPEDAPRLVDLVARTDAEDVHLRFRCGLKSLPESWAARLSQIDWDREMALAAVDAAGDILGVARLAGDLEGETAEFALLVRSDHQQHGLGGALMHRLIDYARQRGYRRLWGSVERRNQRMLVLARELGFALAADVDDVALERVSLMLR